MSDIDYPEQDIEDMHGPYVQPEGDPGPVADDLEPDDSDETADDDDTLEDEA